MLVANTSQVKQQLPEHVLSKSPGRRLIWSHMPEAGRKILNLYSRHTEVSFWSNLYCDLRLAEGLTSITALPILIVGAQKYVSRLISFFFFPSN